jgi:hypothetical protein
MKNNKLLFLSLNYFFKYLNLKKQSKMKFLFVLLISFSTGTVISNELWQATYGGTGVEYATCIINTLDGGFAITGYTSSYGFGDYDICLLKLLADGSLQWVKTLGGENDDVAYSMIQSSDSSYVIVGSTLSYGLGYYEDMIIVKLNSSGDLMWTRTIGRSGPDEAYTLQQTSDGGFFIAGYSVIYSTPEYGQMLVKIDEDGTVEWTKIAQNVGSSLLYPSVIKTVDDGFGIATTINSVIGGPDMFFMKLDNSGSLQWSWAIGGNDYDEAISVCETSDNGYAIAGYTNSFGAGYPDLYIVKLAVGGMLQWTRTIGGDNDDYAFSIMNSHDGGLIVAAECFSFGAGWIDLYLVKLDSRGRFMWGKTIGGPEFDFMRSFVYDSDGGFISVGRTDSYGAGNSDMYIVKTDSHGNTCGNISAPLPVIDSGGTVVKFPVNIYNISPTVTAASPNISGWGSISNLCFTKLNPASEVIPESFSLGQNYPNPFNPVTKIQFQIPSNGLNGRANFVKIIIYDLLGREVTTLVNEQLKPGSYSVDWDGTGYASGVYFYSLVTGEFAETKRMILIK